MTESMLSGMEVIGIRQNERLKEKPKLGSNRDGYLSSFEASEAAGVTYRQLDHWVTRGYVTPVRNPSGSGTQRRWSEENVARLIEIRKAFEALHLVLEGE